MTLQIRTLSLMEARSRPERSGAVRLDSNSHFGDLLWGLELWRLKGEGIEERLPGWE